MGVSASQVEDIATGGGAVDSVNGQTGAVLLTATDVGADASGAAAAAEAAANYYADSLVVGLWDDRGSFDASGGAYPSSGGSGAAGAILKGDIWTISVAGTLPTGQAVEVGDVVRALVNTPGNTQANWAIVQNNIGYVAENSANKSGTISASSSLYPTHNAVIAYAQPLDSDLTAIAALSPSDDSVLQRKAGAWVARTLAQLKADLGVSFTREIQAATFSPADGATLYFGGGANLSPSATANRRRIYFPRACTIIGVTLDFFVTTNGSGENIELYLRINNTTDVQLTLTATLNAGATSYNTYKFTGLSTAIADDTFVEIKMVCPTWVTNPATIVVAGVIECQ